MICSGNPGNPLEEIGRKAGDEELGKCICNLNNGKLGEIKKHNYQQYFDMRTLVKAFPA